MRMAKASAPLPLVHGKPRPVIERRSAPQFTDDEYGLLSEALRIAQQSLIETAAGLDRVYPSSATVERLRLEAENVADLRERIEAR